MAQLTITVPDATVARIRTAFGRADLANPGQWIDATPQEVTDQIKSWVRGRVTEYEVAQAAIASRATKTQETW